MKLDTREVNSNSIENYSNGVKIDNMEQWEEELALGLARWKVNFCFKYKHMTLPYLLFSRSDSRIGRILSVWWNTDEHGMPVVVWGHSFKEGGLSLKPLSDATDKEMKEDLKALGLWLQGLPEDYNWPEDHPSLP